MLKPLIELLVAAVFWGFGFIAAIWSLEKISPGALVFYRFLGAFLVGVLVLLIQRRRFSEFTSELKLAVIPGILMAATLVIQNVGLMHTTATNSAFITSLYIVWVPLIASIVFRTKTNRTHWFYVALALFGTVMMVKSEAVDGSRLPVFAGGDLVTLVCSLFAAGHILSIDRIALKSKDPFIFNIAQCLVGAILALTLFPLESNWSLSFTEFKPWFGLFMMSFGSSLIAFWLQVRAQQKLNPMVASILFLLESPFSALFAYFLLNESLNLQQLAGAMAILLAGLLSIIFSDSKVENTNLT